MAKAKAAKAITITPPNIQTIGLKIQGTAPLMMHKFSEKAKAMMMKKMAEGPTSSKRKTKRQARDYDEDMRQATHFFEDKKTVGIPASAFRNSMIRAAKISGFNMTDARTTVFILADGLGVDGTPLVKLDAGPPERSEMMARVSNSATDIRVRPLWREWSVNLYVQYDADTFQAEEIVNLVARAGLQVGILEGRPFSKSGAGLGYGTWRVLGTIKK